jgi:hypothetical protein
MGSLLFLAFLVASASASHASSNESYDISPAPMAERGRIVAAGSGSRYTDRDGWFVVDIPSGSKGEIGNKAGIETLLVEYPSGPHGQYRFCIFGKEPRSSKPASFDLLQARSSEAFTPAFEQGMFDGKVPAQMTRRMVTLNEFGERFKTRLKMNVWSMAAKQDQGRLQSVSVIGSMETPKGDISVGCEMVHDSQADAILSNALRVAEGVLR